MSDDDFDNVAGRMFERLNIIVRRAITEPRETSELYASTPASAREAAERADGKK